MSGGEDRNIGGKWVKNIVPIIAIAILIALASVQTLSGQEANAGDVNASVQNISDQQAEESLERECGDAEYYRWRLEDSNFHGYLGKDASQVNYSWGSSGDIALDESVQGWQRNWKYVEVILPSETKTFYINCFSGQVQTYEPTPLTLKIDSAIVSWSGRHPGEKANIIVGHFTPTEEKKEILEGLGMEMDEGANEVRYKRSQELGTSYTKLKGYATYDSILKIAELDFVTRITLEMVASGGTGVSGPRITLLANSIDYSIIDTPFLEELQVIAGGGKHVTHITAPDFEQHMEDRFIVILGGPDAPEGVGEIVKRILTKEEQDSVRVQGSKRMFIKENLWASEYQTIFVIAGSDRGQTKLASSENHKAIYEEIHERY